MNRQQVNIYTMQFGQILDVPVLVTFWCSFYHVGENPTGILPVYENAFEWLSTLHFTFATISFKIWHLSVLMRSGLLRFYILHHYSEQVSYQQPQLLWRRLELSTGSFLFILHVLFLQDFQHISFFVRLRIGYIAKAL